MLHHLAEHLHQATGILYKQDIQAISRHYPVSNVLVGDDCAAIPDGEGYLLLAAEGMSPALVEHEPWFAGWCAVMVNLSDIAAMGGRPIALVDTIWSGSSEMTQPLWQGMQAAAQAYGVAIVGGHTNHHSPYNALSVAILGRATRLISSFAARPGDTLLMAVDLNGALYRQYSFWNAATEADPQRLRQTVQILPTLADAGLCDAGKDISMGGIVGTLLMLLETSGCGAVLNLPQIPRPDSVPLERWLLCFPSFGFLLSVRPSQVAVVQAHFQQQQIACAAIGQITNSQQLWLQDDTDRLLFWDLAQTPLTGFTAPEAAP
ncbi:MAG: sll0787 family AIR synthase-like protein [Synechococcales cyanobacterium C42_A2020_086]|nr:sll0787 family AIR synthase-like protein [Synechococcales cyanobacterium C42_A2020_086]